MDLETVKEYFLDCFDTAYIARDGWQAIKNVEGHSMMVAWTAQKIAARMCQNGMMEIDPDEAYMVGLLHDIGKTSPEWTGINHALLGYDMLMKKGWEVAARIALTHSWYGFEEIRRDEIWQELGKKDVTRIKNYLRNHETSGLDKLIQLADNMATFCGVMAISNRFADIVMRHNLHDAGAHLRELYKLKSYFDEKCGINIYELFRSDIIETTMNEPRGGSFDIKYKFNWREDEI